MMAAVRGLPVVTAVLIATAFLFAVPAHGATREHYYAFCGRACQFELLIVGGKVKKAATHSNCGYVQGKGGRIRHHSFRFTVKGKDLDQYVSSPEAGFSLKVSGKHLTAKGVDVAFHVHRVAGGGCDFSAHKHLKRMKRSPLNLF